MPQAALLPPTGHASSAQGTATYLSALTMEGYVIGSVLPFVADIILGSCLPGLLPTPGGRALAWCLGTMLVPAAAAFNAVRAVVDAGGAECKACRALSMGAAATLALQVRGVRSVRHPRGNGCALLAIGALRL